MTHLVAPPGILRNDSAWTNDSLRIQLVGASASRQARGARIVVTTTDGRRMVAHVPAGDSFQSSQDSRVLVAIPNDTVLSEIEVWWPEGTIENWRELTTQPSRTLRLTQGTGQPNAPE